MTTKTYARHRARELLLQAFYQWQLADHDLKEIEGQFAEQLNPKKVDAEFFRQVLHDLPIHLHEINAELEPRLDRPMVRLDPVELAILRLGVYELLYRADIPRKVAINEAVELAKKFGASDGYKFVNGVLDQIKK